jgi:predicted amidohydrolase
MTKMNEDLSYKVAAVQFEPELGKVKENRRRIVKLAVKAASQGAKLIVFPEMATSGYVWESRHEISPFVETIPGATTTILTEISQQYDCFIVIGLPEVDADNGGYYNSAVLVGPSGIIGSYRKTHLFSADPKWAREGKEEIPVFNTSIGKIAMLICMDAMYFEPSRIAALKEADVITFPTNWVGNGGNKPPSKTWRLRAKENGLYWIASNRFGTERGAHFTGGSAIIGPTGDVLESLVTGEGIVFGEIRKNPSNSNNLLTYRKPHAYQEMLLNPYLWKEGETRTLSKSVPYDVVSLPLDSFSSLEALSEYVSGYLKECTFNSEFRLIVLSELSFMGDHSIHLEDCQTLLRDLAEEYSLYIISSFTDKNKSSKNPISFIVGPKGCAGEYTQVHTEQVEMGGKSSSFLVVELPFLRVGLLTGYDAQFPESYRVLSKLGADLISVSSNTETYVESWIQKIRAYENDVTITIATPISSGKSMIFLHSQVSLETSEECSSLHQHFIPTMVTKMRERSFLRRLNHHLYDLLVEEK